MGCAACGGPELRPHLAVAGTAGAEGLIPTTDRFGVALADIVRCTACGHMQLERFPDAAELDRAYEDAESLDYVAEERGQRATARRTLALLAGHARRGRLLDLGCWVGYLLDEARTAGWDARGVEPSEFASRYARERMGLDVVTGSMFEVDLPAGSFDAVVLGDVIEHLPDPGAALATIRSLLAPAGVVALALPDAGSRVARVLGRRWWSVIPTHVQYFTRRSIGVLLERSGFEPLAGSTAPKAFTVRYYLSRIGGYSPALARWLERGAEAGGVADRLWTPDFRDRMLVFARVRA